MWVLAIAGVVAALSTGCVYTTSSLPACAETVLDDWTKGALDATHSPHCYEAAIDALPEDLRAYTTAVDDISRAAISASRAVDVEVDEETSGRELSSASTGEGSPGSFPLSLALVAALVVVVTVGGLAASVIRRRRAR